MHTRTFAAAKAGSGENIPSVQQARVKSVHRKKCMAGCRGDKQKEKRIHFIGPVTGCEVEAELNHEECVGVTVA